METPSYDIWLYRLWNNDLIILLFTNTQRRCICYRNFMCCFIWYYSVSVCTNFCYFYCIEPYHIGATLSSHNLAAGLSNFIAPLIATIMLPIFNEVGVVLAFAICYFVGAGITYYIKVHQPGIDDSKITPLNTQTQNY